jgi:hypothetical protein
MTAPPISLSEERHDAVCLADKICTSGDPSACATVGDDNLCALPWKSGPCRAAYGIRNQCGLLAPEDRRSVVLGMTHYELAAQAIPPAAIPL